LTVGNEVIKRVELDLESIPATAGGVKVEGSGDSAVILPDLLLDLF
jgi:hypothetical protein